MSGGANDMKDLVKIGRVSALIASPLYELDESLALEDVQVALDRPDGAPQG